MTNKEKFAEKLGIDVSEFEIPKVSKTEIIEAQVLFTAIMTDTLLDEEEWNEKNNRTNKGKLWQRFVFFETNSTNVREKQNHKRGIWLHNFR